MSNTSYVSVLTSLCHQWAHRVIKREEELELDEEQLMLISKLFTRKVNVAKLEEEEQEDPNLLELCKLL